MAAVLEISSDERFSSSLEYIKRRVAVYNPVCNIQKFESRLKLVIETAETNKVKQITFAAQDALADIIVTDCKSYYIKSRLRLPINDEISLHAFIKALSTFDRDTDKVIAKTLINITPNFFLDSFYEFMIDVLKSRWNEVCHLANDNIGYLVCGKTFSELLRFLISNIDSLSDEAHLYLRNNKIEIFGRGLKPLNEIYINESLPQDIQIVNKLITIAPKKVFLHEENVPFNKNLIENIQNLFGCCVVIN